jgi:hypothetical protein
VVLEATVHAGMTSCSNSSASAQSRLKMLKIQLPGGAGPARMKGTASDLYIAHPAFIAKVRRWGLSLDR